MGYGTSVTLDLSSLTPSAGSAPPWPSRDRAAHSRPVPGPHLGGHGVAAEAAGERASSRAGGVLSSVGVYGQFSAQADPAVAVAADRELGQVDVAVVAVGEHLRG